MQPYYSFTLNRDCVGKPRYITERAISKYTAVQPMLGKAIKEPLG